MNYNKKIRELQKQIEEIKIKQHNNGMESAIKSCVAENKTEPTVAELKFMEVCNKKGIKLKFQYPIRIVKKNGSIKKFYIADFCDIKNKIIIEVDGLYHEDPKQKRNDYYRTLALSKMGYKVYRITNLEVYQSKSTQFLYNIYRNINKEAFAKI